MSEGDEHSQRAGAAALEKENLTEELVSQSSENELPFKDLPCRPLPFRTTITLPRIQERLFQSRETLGDQYSFDFNSVRFPAGLGEITEQEKEEEEIGLGYDPEDSFIDDSEVGLGEANQQNFKYGEFFIFSDTTRESIPTLPSPSPPRSRASSEPSVSSKGKPKAKPKPKEKEKEKEKKGVGGTQKTGKEKSKKAKSTTAVGKDAKSNTVSFSFLLFQS